MAHDVFISHSSKDKVMADAICAGLEARGIRCWIAPRDVQPGVEWTKAIVDAISDCKVFLLVFSDNTNHSTQIVKEVDCATNDGKTILPFRIEDVKPTGSMKYYLGSLHWLDALTPPVEKQIKKLAEYISHIIGYSESNIPAEVLPDEKHEDNGKVAKKNRKSNIPGKKNRTGLFAGMGAAIVIVIFATVFILREQLFPQKISEPTPTTENTLILEATLTPEPTITPMVSYSMVTKVSPIDGMTMVFVPGGDFLMGSPDNIGMDSEHPQHSVYLDAFWIDQTEVTNAMFQAFVSDTGYITEAERVGESRSIVKTAVVFIDQTVTGANWAHPYGPKSSITGFDNHPVVQVSWYDAQEYCTWAGKRLPTEAEWEKAARGVTGFAYPWGNDFPAGHLANFNAYLFENEPSKDGYQFSAPVGTYPGGKSPYGAMDMAGNVWEWVFDRYDENYYNTGENSNPWGPVEGTLRVMRGGSFFTEYTPLRSAFRERQLTTYSSAELGFRCVMPEKP